METKYTIITDRKKKAIQNVLGMYKIDEALHYEEWLMGEETNDGDTHIYVDLQVLQQLLDKLNNNK